MASNRRPTISGTFVNVLATIVIIAVTWVYGSSAPVIPPDQSRSEMIAVAAHPAATQKPPAAAAKLPSEPERFSSEGSAGQAHSRAQLATKPAPGVDLEEKNGSGDLPEFSPASAEAGSAASRQANLITAASEVRPAGDTAAEYTAVETIHNLGTVFEASQSPASTSSQINPGVRTGSSPDLTGTNPGTRPLDSAAQLPTAEKNKPYCETLPNELSPLPPFSLSAGIIPKGLKLDKENGSICGRPSETGIFRFEITSKNRFEDLIRANYRLTVAEGESSDDDSALHITTSELAVGFLGSIYSFQLSAEGGTGSRTWNAEGLPDGLEFDSENGLIGGTPALDGEFSASFTVKDSEGKTAAVTLPLTVRTTPVFITTSSLAAGVINTVYQERLTAQGGAPPYSWEIIQGALPAGIALSSATGALDGTPTEKNAAIVRFRVNDAAGKNDSADLELKIAATDLSITTSAVAEGIEGSAYSFSLDAGGGTPPYSWHLTAGALPSGLNLAADGTISGTPDLTGEFRFTASVSDQSSGSDDKRFQLRIQDNPEPDPDSSSTSSSSSSSGTPENPGVGGPSSSSSSSSGEGPDNQLGGVAALRAIPSDKKIGLAWKNPARADFVRTVIVRSSDHQPQTVEDGTTVYAGPGNNALDSGENSLPLENGVTYYYSAFADYGSAGISLLTAESSTAAQTQGLLLSGKPDPFADSVVSFIPLDPSGCFNCNQMPKIVQGPPAGGGEYQGSSDIVSLGAKVNSDGGGSAPYGGSITLRFDDNIVVNGPGADFVIYENAFRLAGTDMYFVEPATVEVSIDGIIFYRFPFDFVPHYDQSGEINLFNPFNYAKGFAGIHPVYSSGLNPDPTNPALAGGDPFDLSDIPGIELSWISYIRITATGDGWFSDADGDLVRHSNSNPFYAASGRGNSGFDLDAVCARNY